MAKIGHLSIRAPLPAEVADLAPELAAKTTVAEWSPPSEVDARPIRFHVWREPTGRRFSLNQLLNGWGSQRQAVEEICKIGLRVLELNNKIGPDESTQALVMMFLHFEIMPGLQEFRSRRYKHAIDYRPSAAAGVGLMPQFFLDPPVETGLSEEGEPMIDLSTSRKHECGEAAERVFGSGAVDLLTALALIDNGAGRKPLSRDQTWRAVVRSALAIDANVNERTVERARNSETTHRFIARIEKVGRNDKKDFAKVFDQIRCRGFSEFARASGQGPAISIEEVRRNMLCLCADSFLHLSNLWSAAMFSVRNLITPSLTPSEAMMFDRLYLPQPHLADLPAFLLWPQRRIVLPMTLKLLTAGEGRQMNAIPLTLELFADMDDYTRRHDRQRSDRRTVALKEMDPSGGRNFVSESLLADKLAGLLSTMDLRCPTCKQPVADAKLEPTSGMGGRAIIIRPCGHRVDIAD